MVTTESHLLEIKNPEVSKYPQGLSRLQSLPSLRILLECFVILSYQPKTLPAGILTCPLFYILSISFPLCERKYDTTLYPT
jgi:hypothetical protein